MTPRDFDIDGPGIPGKLFGLPFNEGDARIVILPVPWEATVSYRTGTAGAPAAVLRASQQIDLFHRDIPDAWTIGVTMTEIPEAISELSRSQRQLVERIRAFPGEAEVLAEKVNEACVNLNIYVRNLTNKYLELGKTVGLLGGDHSTPLGLIQALAEKHDRFGILHIDAHADLRRAYEGFPYSHGSIMYNALKSSAVAKLVQVGIRDLGEAEYNVIKRAGGRIRTFFDDDLNRALGAGAKYSLLCDEIISELPQKVYISLDIDGLDPRYCPNTGTPVPGGLDFFHVVELIRSLTVHGKTIIGFDLNEVAANEWDAIVGSRLLWQLTCWTGVSNRWLPAIPVHAAK